MKMILLTFGWQELLGCPNNYGSYCLCSMYSFFYSCNCEHSYFVKIMNKRLESFKWWCYGVRGLYIHIQVFKAMHNALIEYRKTNPPSDKLMKQIRDQEGMIGHCLLHVLCIYKNEDDGFASLGK